MHIFKQLLPDISRSNGARKYFQASCFALIHSCPNSSVEVHAEDQEVVIALGSNVGDRLRNCNEALQLMKKSGVQITRHGCLYETAPAYVTDQPTFLNSAVKAVTKLGPHELLGALKRIEKDMGRTQGIRYGPRPIDLDILFYGKLRVRSETLTIPHERIWERPFVIAPLMDLLGSAIECDVVACWHSFSMHSGGLFKCWEKLGGDSLIGKEGLKRVLPIANDLWDWSTKTSVMGILNLTPDSFSDGGKFVSVETAISQVRLMILEGADMIDIGAQSTRPMASRISVEQELDRLIPVLEAVARMPEVEGKLISVDTFYSEVASEAVSKGAHIVNDISAGQLDSKMLSVVAGLKVPYIAMHMRGDPLTMQDSENLEYNEVCEQVASELLLRVRDAEVLGIPAWRIIIDPGIGFAKNTEQNLDILMGLPNIRNEIARKSLALSHAPIMIGPSRKKFLGDICNRKSVVERDPATVASVTAGVLGGANIVRVHNVRDSLDAVKLCDAMLRHKRSFPQIKNDL
ncbi:folate synthesis bifunctional protein, mitochondrial-like [Argentina anserina]|uniref:folate synthesis bifunctional protein, mitochondrial-like n=1 Tax=Argentina anserina TaxID=57926 RepID=UPI0021766E52|nr:folate synthesis bifunctional protein, mitochondrial-like [Potentilla anserina]XP_050383681.1 folate synthesis bifunctional protein, mitochondrial-like [Potentilla anserina]XP_050383683.1 folate synthesis bifunctional protein, mitochondrial-like [Potentilla anserina]XP_050383684.1 folate synthesis bifunctional protein, mitochondrial-like [Potentilla anserina]XP_050383685.1 folate synthesis bifunctional protein, mitochondrial-like [Potentilla anserina]XP_050383686.1 folate synthesis bifuncti